MRRIVIIGSGPSAIYALKDLIRSRTPLSLTIVESKLLAGVGNPYDPATTDVVMLANIASIELPPVIDRLSDWLLAQKDELLAEVGVSREAIDERAFVPRIAIGAYYKDQFDALVSAAASCGHVVDVLVNSRAVDIVESAECVAVTLASGEGAQTVLRADVVVIATGHGDNETGPISFAAPAYPLEPVPRGARSIGILGSSLSAIDVAVSVALQFGTFSEEDTAWWPDDRVEGGPSLSSTMMSRRGLLPEADFYAPLPYSPLTAFRAEALTGDAAENSLLDRAFTLFQREIAICDPAYAASVRLHEATPEDIAERYFRSRLANDPFDHARANLAEAMDGHRHRRICAWRYAILRMHEPFEVLVPRFSARDKARFNAGLKGIFIDNYAAVPHRSIQRLLALHDAGVLTIDRLSPDYRITRKHGTIIVSDGHERLFDKLYDARGQSARRAVDLPFPTLRLRLLAQGLREGEADLAVARIDVDESFALPAVPGYGERIYVTAVPFMLHSRPSSQGPTASRDIGARVGQAILAQDRRSEDLSDGDATLEALIDGPLLNDDLLLVNGQVLLTPR